MALKSDRVEAYTDISFFCNDASAERGVIAVHSTGGSGVAMDDSGAVVTATVASPSGKIPAGLLLNDVVSLDLTRQHINWHRDEVQTGSKVTLLRQGQVTTNMVVSGVAPTVGQDAYFGVNGKLTNVSTAGATSSGVKVGRFLSVLDADGYIKVDINIT
ncbi:MAG: hypothetical protein EBS93_08585 [Chitinophagia bacterium]|nr:hypothetical protein [Chitinophagia bacterium]NCA30758.1 hypothetical protein [Chitinophagia bacterium]